MVQFQFLTDDLALGCVTCTLGFQVFRILFSFCIWISTYLSQCEEALQNLVKKAIRWMGHTQNFTEIGHSSFRFVSFWHLQTNGFFSTEVHYLCQREREKQKREIPRKKDKMGENTGENTQVDRERWKEEHKDERNRYGESKKSKKTTKRWDRSVNVFFPFIGC